MEQEEYIKEEIDWTTIEFVDNQDILDLVEKKPGGIIALLDETCMLPRSTYETFAQKLYQAFTGHPRFSKPKLSRSDFTIHHYAGDVIYQTDLFLDKNKYYVVAEHREVLNASSCSFISSLFPALSEDSSKSSKFSSVALRFKQQLQSLMETLNATQPHYIRCVKPNSLLRPAIFENTNVLQQLRCGGVLEAIRISCAGYPTRRLFDEFIYRFGLLAPKILDESYDEATMAKKLLDAVGIAGYQIGKTKVFLRAGQMAELDARRNEVQTLAARRIQRKARTILARKNFILLQKSAIQLQAVCRGQIARELYSNMRRRAASLIIQKHYRMHLAKRAYTYLCLASINIQAGVRGMAARKEFHLRRVTRAAIIIQSYWRRYLARVQYSRLKKAAITTQSAWRGRVARKELRKLKMAARETGALQAAKNKLERQVEEVTLRLQLERRLRVEIEEAKSQEIAKLQIALQDMQLELKNTKDLLVKEKESTKEATERSTLGEVLPVFDDKLMEKITSENEQLKALVSSLETKISETEKKYEETSKVSEERLKKALEAESKLSEFDGLMRSFQEKLSNMESENQILRKQTLVHSPVKATTESLSISASPLKHKSDNNNNQHIQEPKENQAVPPTVKAFANSDSTLRRSYVERQHKAVDALVNYATGTIGFSHGKPIPALIIYKCLLQWKSFEAERTNVFDRLIQMIGSSIQNEESIDHLSYWLSSASTLLALLQISLKAANTNAASQKPPIPTTFFGRMAQGFRASSANISVDGVKFIRHVEAKYPALLFKQQLTAYVEIIYGIIRDNVKKDLTPLLSLCAQAPRTARANSIKRSSSKNVDKTNHWRSLVEKLDDLLKVFQENYVPKLLIKKLFTQIFSFINAQLFNSLLLRRECCSFSNGEYMKSGLTELEAWCKKTNSEYLDSSWDELKHIRQAVGFLVIFQKYRISYDDIVNELCPMLSVRQMYKLCTQYWDDKYNSQSVSSSVLSSMNTYMAQDVDESGSKFLLDDDGSIPFTLDDVASSIEEKDFLDVKLPEEILENPSFQFLQD